MNGQKYFPINGLNRDISNQLLPPTQARFIKNLVYSLDDAAIASQGKGASEGTFKPLQSTIAYFTNLILPGNEEDNARIGYLTSKETREVFVFVYNKNSQHLIYKINGYDGTYNIIFQGPQLGFTLNPENSIHIGGAALTLTYITDPVTGEVKKRSFLAFTTGLGRQWNICVEDAVSTSGFSKTLFPYFDGDYRIEDVIAMGVPTPSDCIEITEIPRTEADMNLPNQMLFKVWYFRILGIDVWGRPSEHGIISDAYIPGVNDCIGASPLLPRCVNLKFPAPNPFIDKIQIEFMRCGDTQWQISDTLFLYQGSSLGEWWKRSRNPDVNFNSGDGTISYKFCRDKECQPIAIAETSRLFNPLPRSSQSVFQLGGLIGLANNEDGFLPLSEQLRKAVKLTIIPPEKTSILTASITIYVAIWNPALDNFQSVERDVTNSVGFLWGDNNSKHGTAIAYKQFFLNQSQSGFQGYLVGAEGLVTSTQWYIDSSGNFVQDTELKGNSISPNRITFQKFVFTNVPRGNYIFRLISHLTDATTNQNPQNTSTTVWGLCQFNNVARKVDPYSRRPAQELQINVCNGDYNTLNENQMLCICDMAAFVDNQPYKATSGYIHETVVNSIAERPMELVKVTSQNGYTSVISDHNGFFYFATRGSGRTFKFEFYYKCAITSYSFGEGNAGMRDFNIIIDQINFQNNIRYSDYASLPCNRVLIKGRLVLSGKNIGVPNVTVILTRGQYAITDVNGFYTVIAHDDSTTGVRDDKLYIAGGGCNYTDVNGNCLPITNISFSTCNSCVERVVNISNILLRYASQKGLLSGGTYQVGIEPKDWLRRMPFVQPIGSITIPSISESQTVGASQVQVDIDPAAVFPLDFDEFTIWITRETTIAQYVDWIVDDVQFIDNTGNVNNTAPTQIRIYYASLIEFNKQNNYNTTVNWNFLETVPGSTTQTPVRQDTVQFFINGDGKFFGANITALVKYDQTGQYFLIDYTDALKDLKANALIRLSRPKVCTGNEGYFEICNVVKLKNGKPDKTSFILNAFDTYYINRSIPVPTSVNPSNASTVSETAKTTTNDDGSKTTITSTINQTVNTVNQLRQFGFLFEHDAPSNFWGKGCFNGGRENIKNPYETIIYNFDQLAMSGGASVTGQLNFLNYFDEAKKFSFDTANLNGIVAVLPQLAEILIIGQADNGVVGYNDTIARVNEAGQIIAPSIKNTFGAPLNKIGGNYGCQLFDKQTIQNREGITIFLDSDRAALVKHNYQLPKPVSYKDLNGHITSKIKYVTQYNLKNDNTRYFVGVINPINNEYLLTDFVIGSNSFTNEFRDFDVTAQETLGFGIFTEQYKGSYMYTPEGYAALDSDINDLQLFSFIHAKPYRHNTIFNPTFGMIYGKKASRSLKIVANAETLKKKKYLSVSVYCKQGAYFCDVINSETGQNSRILLSQFLEAEYGWYAPVLKDTNFIDPNLPSDVQLNSIFEGNPMIGTWCEFNFVSDPATDDQYSELLGIVINAIGSDPSGATANP